MTLSDDVIRFLTLRVDEHEEGPSVMMRDDRPRRDTRPPRKSFDDKNKTFGDKKDEDKKGDDS